MLNIVSRDAVVSVGKPGYCFSTQRSNFSVVNHHPHVNDFSFPTMFSSPRASESRDIVLRNARLADTDTRVRDGMRDVEKGRPGGKKFTHRRPRANESAKEQTLGPQRSVIIHSSFSPRRLSSALVPHPFPSLHFHLKITFTDTFSACHQNEDTAICLF